MRILPYRDTRRIIIEPGEFYVSRHQEVISTLLGSCVSACLFDPVNRVMGMNHFLLAYHQETQSPIIDSEKGRYGIHAMQLLIDQMIHHGADRPNLKAKCFGGGNMLSLHQSQKSIGDTNAKFIQDFLHTADIPLLRTDLGGNQGRNVHFIGSDYSVLVKNIDYSHQAVREHEIRHRKNDSHHR